MFLMYKLYHIIFTVSIALLKFNIFVKFDENDISNIKIFDRKSVRVIFSL